MNIIFFGSSKVAVPSLKALIARREDISCAVTQPDRKKGRGLHYEGTAVKMEAAEAGLKIFQPEDINCQEALQYLKILNPDLFIVISYGQILSREILDIPKLFAINAHASILPAYRGAAPINWAVIKGEKTTGITIMKMSEKMDAGPIILRKTVDIEESDTSISLEGKLSETAAEVLTEALDSLKNNTYKLTPQDETKKSYAPKLKKEDGLIDWHKSASVINNIIRGCIDWPGAFTHYKGMLLKIYKAKIYKPYVSIRPQPGQIIKAARDGITVATGTDDLIIEELQLEGRRRMGVADFVLGHKVKIGEILGKK